MKKNSASSALPFSNPRVLTAHRKQSIRFVLGGARFPLSTSSLPDLQPRETPAGKRKKVRNMNTFTQIKMKRIGTLLLALFLGVCFASHCEATVYNSDGSAASVQALHNAVLEGDTITLPAGTFSWATTVACSKGIVIQGAGMGQTTIVDNVPRANPSFGHVFDFSGSGTWRLTGLTVTFGSVTSFGGQTINAHGSSHAFRIDHVKINDTYAYHQIETSGDLWGVIDHNNFITTRGSVGINVGHDSWQGVGAYGDNSWAQATNLGSSEFVFVEDNTYSSTGGVQDFVDGLNGARYVARHNTTTNGSLGGGHGTDSGQRARSVRAFEVYENNLSSSSIFSVAAFMRGGTGVIYGNTLSNFQYAAQGANYRDVDSFAPWGACNGISPWDTTDGVVYVSGTHNGGNGVALVLTDTGKNFTTAASGRSCVNFSVTNVTQGWSSVIASMTTTTATAMASNYGVARNWNTGDSYQIRRACPSLDQVGRGAGVLLANDTPTPSGPVNQVFEPVYVWSNTGYTIAQCGGGMWASVQLGRDFIDNGTTPKPGYTPYTYPHPLVVGTGGSAADAQHPPTPKKLKLRWRARKQHSKTIGLTGGNWECLAKCVDIAIPVRSTNTARVQECHNTIGHLFCDSVERDFCGGDPN